jgi:hypothetical protein
METGAMTRNLGKLLTEKGKSRPRRWHGGNPAGKNLKEDQLPSRTNKKYIIGTKCGGDWNTKVIHRIIKSAVGQPWNKVFSKLQAGVNPHKREESQALRFGIERYLNQEITEIREVNGQKVPHDSKGKAIYDRHWVHPRSGLIMTPVKQKEKPAKKYPPKYIEIDGHFCRVCFQKETEGLYDREVEQTEKEPPVGLWYEFEMVPLKGFYNSKAVYGQWGFIVDPDDNPFPVYDAYLNKQIQDSAHCKRVHGRYMYAKSKRQLNSEEIRKLGLANKFAGTLPKDQQ